MCETESKMYEDQIYCRFKSAAFRKRKSARKYLKTDNSNYFKMNKIASILLEWFVLSRNGNQICHDMLVRYDLKTTPKTICQYYRSTGQIFSTS
jgi:hypothetical protein